MRTLSILIAAGLALTCSSFAQSTSGTATTDPVGYMTLTCTGSSDTRIAPPLTRAPEYVGSVQSVSTLSSTTANIALSGTPSWTTNQFVYSGSNQNKTYYVLLSAGTTSNPKEGSFYTITGNDASSLTIYTNGDDLSNVPANSQAVIIPYWTLATLFPSTDAGVSYVVSTSPLSRKTELQIPNYGGSGINLSAAKTYYYYNSGWRQVGKSASEDHGDDPFLPNAYFIVRNNNSPSTTLTCSGNVSMKKYMVPVATQASTKQDNILAMTRPVDVTLNQTGLIASGAFAASTSPLSRTDELYTFDNTTIGINKSAAATYYYYNNAWRKLGQSSSIDFGNDVIPAGSGFIVRSGTTAGGVTRFWQNSTTY